MAERGPRDLRDAAAAFLDRADRRGGRATARASAVWAGAVGPEIASRTHAVAVRDGELLVGVDSSAWATELSAMSSALAAAVNEKAGEDLVSSVRFTVTAKVAKAKKTEAEDLSRSGESRPRLQPEPLSAEERAQLEHVAAAIDDDELRAAALRAMTADMEWKKAQRRAARTGPQEGGGAGPGAG